MSGRPRRGLIPVLLWATIIVPVFLLTVGGLTWSMLTSKPCGNCGRLPDLRVKVTISLSINGVRQERSAIQELQPYATQSFLPMSNGVTTYVGGEAVAFDMAGGGAVLALMATPDASGGYWLLLLRACGLLSRPGETPPDHEKRIRSFVGRCEMTAPHIPMVIWVPDSKSPLGLEAVLPEAISEQAPRVAWISGTIETTDQPPTLNLRSTLPWLAGGRPAGAPWIKVAAQPRPHELGIMEFSSVGRARLK